MNGLIVDSDNVHLVIDIFVSTYQKRFQGKKLTYEQAAQVMEWLMKTQVAFAQINGWELEGLHEGLDKLWNEADEILQSVTNH